MPKTLTLDGAPSDFFRPDDDLLNKWREKRGIIARKQENDSGNSPSEKQKKAS